MLAVRALSREAGAAGRTDGDPIGRHYAMPTFASPPRGGAAA